MYASRKLLLLIKLIRYAEVLFHFWLIMSSYKKVYTTKMLIYLLSIGLHIHTHAHIDDHKSIHTHVFTFLSITTYFFIYL